MNIDVIHHGDFTKTYKFLTSVEKKDFSDILEKYGRLGVVALSSATPVDTGKTASSWEYTVRKFFNHAKITWSNTNIVNGVPVAILIQYGHGTRGGTYVEGIDFINPAMRSIFDQIAEDIWKEVTSL